MLLYAVKNVVCAGKRKNYVKNLVHSI